MMTKLQPGACLFALAACALLSAQNPPPAPAAPEKLILAQLRGLRAVPDSERPAATASLAIRIRELPPGQPKLNLASALANLATEGDPGAGTLQQVAATLAQALSETPAPDHDGQPAMPYLTLAQLVRYEHVVARLDAPPFAAAMASLEAADQRRQAANFTLTDLHGKPWTLQELRGQVVLVNFWATWCPPCRKEMPDLEALHQRFAAHGLRILAISDEEPGKVEPFIAQHSITYTILLDPGRKVNELFQVEGIPKTFVYDRQGRLAAQAIDMRTRRQFLDLLSTAGLDVSAAR